MSKRPNHSIRCDVDSCRHLCQGDGYCSLDCISVGCASGGTHCCSFAARSGATGSTAEEHSRRAFAKNMSDPYTDVYGPASALVEDYRGVVDNRSDSANTQHTHTYPWGNDY